VVRSRYNDLKVAAESSGNSRYLKAMYFELQEGRNLMEQSGMANGEKRGWVSKSLVFLPAFWSNPPETWLNS